MKKEFAALFFYMLYMIAMMRPVMPVLEYYANYEYIATVLCENRDKPAMACNGKCYLEKQLVKVAQPVSHQKHQHKSNIPQIDMSKYPVAPFFDVFRGSLNSSILINRIWVTLEGDPIHKTNSIFRPPLFVV
jgi:hypothetical protein